MGVIKSKANFNNNGLDELLEQGINEFINKANQINSNVNLVGKYLKLKLILIF